MGPALAISMHENPPAAAASAKPADIFKASLRWIWDMKFSRRLKAYFEYRHRTTYYFIPEYNAD
jgi:hypothetical protein